jgi:hypothetical protein
LNLEEPYRTTVEEYVRRHKLLGFVPWAGTDAGGRDVKHAQA